jgi:hypothetical protein
MRAKQEIPERKRRSSEEIKRLVLEFETSGLRQNEFCRNHGLALSTLQLQLKKRRVKNGEAKAWGERSRAESHRLVAVELARRDHDGNSRPACALKMVLASGRRIEVGPDFDSDTLERLVRILERL